MARHRGDWPGRYPLNRTPRTLQAHYWGSPYRIGDNPWRRAAVPELMRTAHEQIIDWYRATGLAWLKPRAKDWSTRLRVDPQTVEVADLGNTWGSALPSGRVRIHWATMQLRPSLVEYVLAHELAHLREPHHGPAFWQLLGRARPDFDQRKSALAEAGTSIWMGVAFGRQIPCHTRPTMGHRSVPKLRQTTIGGL
jgi:predicted metal-dependent hydrolase